MSPHNMLLLFIIRQQLTQILEMFDPVKKVLAVEIWGAHDSSKPSVTSTPIAVFLMRRQTSKPWRHTSLRLPV